MSQTSVVEQSRALIGQKYALLKAENVMSYAAEVRIGFGRFVGLGTDKAEQVLLPAAATSITSELLKRGVALQSHARENAQDGLIPGYEISESVSVMTKGGVFVECEEAVVETDVVYVRFVAGAGGTELGIFRNDADTASAAILASARFLRASELIDGKHVALLELL